MVSVKTVPFNCNSCNRNTFTATDRITVKLFLLVTESDFCNFYMIYFLTTNLAVLFRVLYSQTRHLLKEQRVFHNPLYRLDDERLQAVTVFLRLVLTL